ncbi:MAG: hypothetical protein M3R36_13365 [Bacteroidota bacterium]|nr:hypothetical protein [Bacteroidota bacterium]
MQRTKEYENELITIVKKEKEAEEKKEFTEKIINSIILILKKSNSIDDVINKVKIKLSELEKKTSYKNRRISEFKVAHWIRRNKPELEENYKVILYKTFKKPEFDIDKAIKEHIQSQINKDRWEQMFTSESMLLNDIFEEQEIKILVNEFDKFLNQNPRIRELLNDSVKSYIQLLGDDITKLENNIKQLKKDRIYLYEYIISRKKQIDNLDVKDIKTLFELEKDLVTQNENMYPILFNYFDYIKKEVLNKYEATNRHTTNEEVYKYISSLTISIKWTAVKTYYNQKFLLLLGIKK